MAQNSNRGFAGMDPEEQRRIASSGGRAAHANGNAHEWDSQEAAEAGHLGGLASHHHDRAAFHHETAAHHHSRAAAHRASGNSRQAQLHAGNADSHGREANYHAGEASRHGRGFAGMDPERRRELAREGGRASHGGRGGDDYSGQDNGPNRSPNNGNSSSTRGGTSEQRADAGRRGAEARWSSRDQDDSDEYQRGNTIDDGTRRNNDDPPRRNGELRS